MSWVAVAVASASAVGAYSANEAQNEAMEASQENERRRYQVKAGIAKNQMEELNTTAMSKMTKVSRDFIVAKSKLEAQQAESGVTGNVRKRLDISLRSKASEAKGQIARDTNISIINSANNMLSQKVDSDTNIARAEANKITGLAMMTSVLSAGAKGFAQGKSLKGSFGSGGNSLNIGSIAGENVATGFIDGELWTTDE